MKLIKWYFLLTAVVAVSGAFTTAKSNRPATGSFVYEITGTDATYMYVGQVFNFGDKGTAYTCDNSENDCTIYIDQGYVVGGKILAGYTMYGLIDHTGYFVDMAP